MASDYQCPECKSKSIKIGYPDIVCLDCGYSGPLIDFPISWDWHRHYCREFGRPDPGPCEPPEHNIEEFHERLAALEELTLSSEKPGLEVDRPREKPKPRLSGGVRL